MPPQVLEPLGEELWCVRAPFSVAGVRLGVRMTIARLPAGGLWLHSPVPLSEEVRAALRDLGQVAHVVAPSKVHHLFVADALAAFPEAMLHCAPGLGRKVPALAAGAELGPVPEPAWAGVLEQEVLGGVPYMNEVVFFHRPSRSLIVTDLLFNIGESSHAWTRLYLRGMGAYGAPRQSRMVRLCCRDRRALGESVDRILGWPFERIVVTHGAPIETDTAPGARTPREFLAEACAWCRSSGG